MVSASHGYLHASVVDRQARKTEEPVYNANLVKSLYSYRVYFKAIQYLAEHPQRFFLAQDASVVGQVFWEAAPIGELGENIHVLTNKKGVDKLGDVVILAPMQLNHLLFNSVPLAGVFFFETPPDDPTYMSLQAYMSLADGLICRRLRKRR